MRLVSVGVHGFKRFAARTQMNVGGRVVAIVGPNEAGKTSLLNALQHLEGGVPFENSDWTRGLPRPTGYIVWARFLIDDEDREAIGRVPGVNDLKWYVLSKQAHGVLRHRVEPAGAVYRDLGPRWRCRKLLERAADHPTLRDPENEGTRLPIANRLAELAVTLDSESDTLDDEEVELITNVGNELEAIELPAQAPKYLRELSEKLTRLGEHESPHAGAFSTRHTPPQILVVWCSRKGLAIGLRPDRGSRRPARRSVQPREPGGLESRRASRRTSHR